MSNQSTENQNAPAHPINFLPGPSVWQREGLTKREWMVGMVAAGYVANKDRPQFFQPEDDAAWIVRLADLLLEKARG